ncbi:MAG: hypothetical protein V7K40_04000 [Nostoc sp.]
MSNAKAIALFIVVNCDPLPKQHHFGCKTIYPLPIALEDKQ